MRNTSIAKNHSTAIRLAYNHADMALWRAGFLATCIGLAASGPSSGQSPPPPPASPPPDAPVLCEFLVFDGDHDVTGNAFLHVYASGSREHELSVEPSDGRLQISLPTAIYDVQAFGREDEGIVNVKWTERIVVTHYPDERGEHLEVINFKPRFGAVQFASLRDAARDYEIQFFRAGVATGTGGSTIGQPAQGELVTEPSYQLFVLTSGRYDVRIRRRAGPASAAVDGDEHWLRDYPVAANRTQVAALDRSSDTR